VNVIETAMKDFYNNDAGTMIKAIQLNITVSKSTRYPTLVSTHKFSGFLVCPS
jgi:hypothetical protein